MGKDEVFSDEIEEVSDFKFSAGVAKVFDDMVNKPVPFMANSADGGGYHPYFIIAFPELFYPLHLRYYIS
jgi:hypothetical protein